MERYDGGEVARNSKWKQERSFPPYQEKEEQRNLGVQSHRPAEREYSEGSVPKIAYEYSHKRRRHLEGEKPFSDERALKYVKQEEQKYGSKGARNSKELDYLSGRRARRTEGHIEAPDKCASKKGCNACVNSSKLDVDLRAFKSKSKERVRKEGEIRKKIDSSDSQRDPSHTVSDVKMTDVSCRRERLTIKVDMKKMVTKYRYWSPLTSSFFLSSYLFVNIGVCEYWRKAQLSIQLYRTNQGCIVFMFFGFKCWLGQTGISQPYIY